MSEQSVDLTWQPGAVHQVDCSLTIHTNSKEAALMIEQVLVDKDPRQALLTLIEMIVRVEEFEGNKDLPESEQLVFQAAEIANVDINWDDDPQEDGDDS
jgi:hypothetical protein